MINESSKQDQTIQQSERKFEEEIKEDKPRLVQKEIFRTKRSYVPVELDKREKLIKAVEDQGLTIKEAAYNLKINYSTAKHIVKVYKRTGEL